MSSFKLRLLVGAGALMAASALAAQASATTVLQGGGSSLLAPYWTQAVGCWDSDTGNGTYVNKGTPGTIVTPTAITGCTKITGTQIKYVSAGSGAGTGATFAHDGAISLFGTNPDGSGSKVFTSGGIQYGLSDNALVDSDVGVYVVGTGVSYTPPNGRATITTPATYQGFTFSATGNYPVAKPLYGPLVQFPVSIDPVALAFNPTYKTGFQLQLNGGVLKLDANAYCKIFTGAITDWGDAALTALNGGTSLKAAGDTGAAPIKLIGRSDSSGTTSIFTRHLAKACDSVLGAANNPYGTAGTTLLSNLPAATFALYTTAAGSGGVATAINGNFGSIGYIGPDYVLPAVNNTGLNTYNLPAAQLKNAAGNYEAPNALRAADAFTGINPPTGANRSDATLWVQSTSETAPIANPTASTAYPIVGTTNFLGYTCYASASSVTSLRAFLTFGGGTKAATILSNAGLSQLPTAWLTAIGNAFVTPNANNNLFFATAGTGTDGLGDGFVNTNCTASGVVGG